MIEPPKEELVIAEAKRLKRIEKLAREVSANTRAVDKYYDPAWQELDTILGMKPEWTPPPVGEEAESRDLS